MHLKSRDVYENEINVEDNKDICSNLIRICAVVVIVLNSGRKRL